MAVAAVMVVLLGAPAAAQRMTTRFPVPTERTLGAQFSAPVTRVDDDPGRRVAGGLLGGLAGVVVGALLGYHLERSAEDTCYDWCGLGGFVLGGTLGEGIGFGTGAYLFDRNRRTYTSSVLMTTALAGAGVVAAIAAENVIPIVLVVPVQAFLVAR